MERQTSEILSGVGEIYAGDRLLRRTTYRLEVVPDPSRPDGSAAAVSGNIDITGMGETVVLAGAEHLILRLEDGRALPFHLGSTSGRIEAEGVLPAPLRHSSR